MRASVFVWAAAVASVAATSFAQDVTCVPGNPFYDRGDYRCFPRRPVPTRARPTVRSHVEGARFLSGGALPEHLRQSLEDHFDALGSTFGGELPSLVDDRGALHTPDVRLAVVLLPSGSVGRVRLLNHLGTPLDRSIARALVESVSTHAGMTVRDAEVEVIVRLRPALHYARWRRAPNPDCCEE